MDFDFTPEQQAVAEAAAGIVDGLATPERVAEVEASDERVDRRLWQALADGDLLGLAVPESDGGAGLGVTELCLLLVAQGRRVAPAPLWSTLVLGGLPVARFGSPAQRAALLPGVTEGSVLLTAALHEAATSLTSTPAVRATAGSPAGSGGGWVLEGTSMGVPAAHVASRILVPARTGEGDVVVALVDPSVDGVRLERAITTNREVHPHLHLDGVAVGPDEVLVEPTEGAAALQWMLRTAWTGLCALALGVAESALEQTATYLNERQQFGKPLSTFQGAMLRAADAAIDTEAMRVTLWQAAWRIDTDRPAAEAVATARWQAAERGQRVVHATQHLHGGIGADITYPIHRYFLWGKQLELMLGGPSLQLARLGRLIAASAGERVAAGIEGVA